MKLNEKDPPQKIWISENSWWTNPNKTTHKASYVPESILNEAGAIIERKDREISQLKQKLITEQGLYKDAASQLLDKVEIIAGLRAELGKKAEDKKEEQ